jgi:hypothetical protein
MSALLGILTVHIFLGIVIPASFLTPCPRGILQNLLATQLVNKSPSSLNVFDNGDDLLVSIFWTKTHRLWIAEGNGSNSVGYT